ncbi:MAG: beta-lactamase family protein, partial [Lachnospiraceae bacterium]|nr:beta-lactamase family protein [Lachnospiraceae bacterium]
MKNFKLLISLMIAGLVMTAIPMNLKAEGKINSSGEEKKIFSIASVSKMYAVTAVMQLVDDGKVDIDAPVTDYITDFRLADERYKDITVRMLMNHTSGLMGSVVTDSVRYDDKSTDYNENFLEVLSKERLKAAPGEYNCYCNDGFTLLEILVERVSGMSFTEYMEENISLPLGLDNTGSMWNMETSNLAQYYMNGNIRMTADVCQTIGAGGVMTDVEELCTFGSAFFEGNNVLLSEEAKNMMAENQVTGLSTECYGL